MINLIVVGKLKERSMQELSDEYLKRIQPYHKLQIIELKDFSTSGKLDSIKKESELILKAIKPQDYVIVLDLQGKDIDSVSLSEKIDDIFLNNSSHITFVIGGSMGLSDEVKSRSNFKWKLSNLTFTHQFARIIALEQIYRTFKILANEPYHK